MANELTLSASLDFFASTGAASLEKAAVSLDVSGTEYTRLIQEIGTSEEALTLGDVATPGYCLMYNHDSTNYVEIRAGSGQADVVKIPPKGIALFCFATATPYAIADTAAVRLEYLLIEA